jgi:hypothetical protein
VEKRTESLDKVHSTVVLHKHNGADAHTHLEVLFESFICCRLTKKRFDDGWKTRGRW